MSQINLDSFFPEQVEIIEVGTEFRSIWEVSSGYRCPLIGSCLNGEEHKRLLKKGGIRIKGMKLYTVHGVIMQHLHDKNRVSSKIDSYLRHKYQKAIECYGCISEVELEREWTKRLEWGGFEELFYIACIRRDISNDLLDDMFGEIHMMSHAGVNSAAQFKRDLDQQKKQTDILEERSKNQKQCIRDLKKENRLLQQNLKESGMKRSADEASGALAAVSCQNRERDTSIDFSENAELKKENRRLMEELRDARKTIAELQNQTEEYKTLNDHLQGDIEELISHFKQFSDQEEKTTDTEISRDLDSKRVLIVGGMTKIKHLYQHVVEANGGSFEYHDGYSKNGNSNLAAKVSRSDIIICPVNCNSHNACSKVKKLCQKHKKPLKILQNASVSSISTALFNQQANLNASRL